MSKKYYFEAETSIGAKHRRELNNASEATKLFEKLIKSCNITPELKFISREHLPSPRYRASVCKYLKEFFYTATLSPESTIDFSDYDGERYSLDDRVLDEFYEISFYDECEEDMGFAFTVSNGEMHLQCLEKSSLQTLFYYKKLDGFTEFVFYPDTKEGRNIKKAKIIEQDELGGSFYIVLLLSILEGACDEEPLLIKNSNEYKESLSVKIWDFLAKKREDSSLILPKTMLSERTIQRYLASLREFGYDIKEEGNAYYLPPFICKADVDRVVECIECFEFSPPNKKVLIEKFKQCSGYYRFAINDAEESKFPMPQKKDNWSPKFYSLMIYNMLRLCARPLHVSSESKDNLWDLIENNYGTRIKKRQTISKNIKTMMAMGFPINKSNGGYCFDSKKTLNEEELKLLLECITNNSSTDTETKKRLIEKIDNNIPIKKF